MTELAFVRRHFPGVKPRWAQHILWSMTSYPCYGIEHAEQQLRALRAKIGPPNTRGWLRKLDRETREIDRQITEELQRLRNEKNE